MKQYKFLVLGLLFFGLSACIAYIINTENFKLLKIENLNDHKLPQNLENQFEVVFTYIGSSECKFCLDEKVSSAYKYISPNLEYDVNKQGFRFITVGISRDSNISNGLIHLSGFGKFDEVIVGNNWNNSGILKYVYGDIPGIAATPQFVVTLRKYKLISQNNGLNGYRGLEEEILLLRKVGVREIDSWVNTSEDHYLPDDLIKNF
jgi:hypothetical protein